MVLPLDNRDTPSIFYALAVVVCRGGRLCQPHHASMVVVRGRKVSRSSSSIAPAVWCVVCGGSGCMWSGEGWVTGDGQGEGNMCDNKKGEAESLLRKEFTSESIHSIFRRDFLALGDLPPLR